MPQGAWNEEHERQDGNSTKVIGERGYSEDDAEPFRGPSSSRGRSRPGEGGPTYDQLYNEARVRNVHGRSKMNKEQLARALGRAS